MFVIKQVNHKNENNPSRDTLKYGKVEQLQTPDEETTFLMAPSMEFGNINADTAVYDRLEDAENALKYVKKNDNNQDAFIFELNESLLNDMETNRNIHHIIQEIKRDKLNKEYTEAMHKIDKDMNINILWNKRILEYREMLNNEIQDCKVQLSVYNDGKDNYQSYEIRIFEGHKYDLSDVVGYGDTALAYIPYRRTLSKDQS